MKKQIKEASGWRKPISIIAAMFIVAASFAQEKSKQDTTIQVTISLNDFRALLYGIDVNIDSKKASKEIIDFLQKNARIVQPADKPKEQHKKN